MTQATSPYLNQPIRSLEEAMLDLHTKPLPRAIVPQLVDGKLCRVSGTVVGQTYEAEPRIDVRPDGGGRTIVNVPLAEAEIEAQEGRP